MKQQLQSHTPFVLSHHAAFFLLLVICLFIPCSLAASGCKAVEIDFRNLPDSIERSFKQRLTRIARQIEISMPDVPYDELLECKVFATVALDGTILKGEIEESSGDSNFDNAAISSFLKLGNLGQFPEWGRNCFLRRLQFAVS
jgi:hypothetical protein